MVQEGSPVQLDRAGRWDRIRHPQGIEHYLSGGVEAHRGQVRMVSEEARYRDWEGRLVLTGRVSLEDPDYRVWADKVTYLVEEDLAQGRGSVRIVRKAGGSELRAGEADYYARSDRVEARGQPLLILYPGGAEPGMSPYLVRAPEMVLLGEEEVLAWGGVSIEGDQLAARADSAAYEIGEGWLFLRQGRPEAWTESHRLEGDSLDVRLVGGRLRESWVRGEPLAEARAEPASWIRGREIQLEFEDGRLARLSAWGKARSLLYLVDQSAPDGPPDENYVMGDEIILSWTVEGLDLVEVEGATVGVMAQATPADAPASEADHRP